MLQNFRTLRTRGNQFENVAAGSTALLSLPIGPTYTEIDIQFSGVTVAQMTEIRVKINGEIRHRYSAAQLDKINRRTGMLAADTRKMLTIPFVRRGLKTLEQEVASALFTGSQDQQGRVITSVDIEIDIAGTASNPRFECFHHVGDNVAGGPGMIISYYRETFEANIVGEKQVPNLVPLNDPKRLILNRAFFFVDETKIDRIRVRRNQLDIFDYEPFFMAVEAGEFDLTGFGDMVVVDPTVRGYGANGWPVTGSNDFRFLIETNEAISQIDAITEVIGELR